ncbi:unnamed protein product [Aphis gossypii]|uniref:Uncharacterized protein n=1 Tax=Aphis gossypii TaxID=80765 RepID=A0A9P0NIP6_APHGO|nr:unnamed protein product [Aphis gossypii]
MNLNLSDSQIKKLSTAFNKNTDVVIQLKYTQIEHFKNIFDLTDRQKNKLRKAKKKKV